MTRVQRASWLPPFRNCGCIRTHTDYAQLLFISHIVTALISCSSPSLPRNPPSRPPLSFVPSHPLPGTKAQFGPTMLVKVKLLTGNQTEIDIDPTDTIWRIKERVEEKAGIDPKQQRLIFGGRQLADDRPANEYNIEGGSVLHLVIALRGGSC